MKRSVVAVVVAAVLAVIGCGAVLLYVGSADARALKGQRAVSVLLATKRIPAGTTGAEVRAGKYLESATLPATSVPRDAMTKVEADLDALVLTADVQPRQVLLRGAFEEDTNLTGGLAIPDGKIAVTIEVPGGAALQFIRPGSKVVVFDTFSSEDGKRTPAGDRLAFIRGTNHTTRVLLPRVEVIAVGLPGEATAATSTGKVVKAAPAEGEKEEKPAKGTAAVTVAVSQGEAERLVHGAQTGTLFVAVVDDTSDVRPGPGVDNNSLFQ
ncbi:MAG TPA: RcpC/CpaB family pilus assembly protein [Micromonosporaceae bacterium]|nr:RcpC/CpaB family pilus assembly protein [Micromonosporaceae bacterium]